MTSPAESQVIDGALTTLRNVLTADGYDLRWALDGRQIDVDVVAGPDACAECLVPAEVMKAIVGDALDGTPYRIGDVHLPAHS